MNVIVYGKDGFVHSIPDVDHVGFFDEDHVIRETGKRCLMVNRDEVAMIEINDDEVAA